MDKLQRRFSKKVRVDPSSGCWVWVGAKHKCGYGKLWVGGSRISAHRVAWELFRGPIPPGQYVLHNCPVGDNRGCCNPDHLFVGSHKDNMRDMVEKGRSAFGERHPRAKLTEDAVRDIRARHSEGIGSRALAQEYGVCIGTVAHVVSRRLWGFVE